MKASVPGEVIVFLSKEAYSSETQKGQLLLLGREEQGDLSVQAVTFIWIQRDVAIINFRIPLFPNNALSPGTLSETVNLSDDVINSSTYTIKLLFAFEALPAQRLHVRKSFRVATEAFWLLDHNLS